LVVASATVLERNFDPIGKLGWVLLARGALNAYYENVMRTRLIWPQSRK
jgi:hypothetical protein